MAKLPNDGSADPLGAVYDVDLTVPADKVVRLDLTFILVLVIFTFLFSQAGLSHTATDVVNSTLGLFNIITNNLLHY